MFVDSLKKRIYHIIVKNNFIRKDENKENNLKNVLSNCSLIESLLRKEFQEYRRSPKNKLYGLIMNVIKKSLFVNYDKFMIKYINKKKKKKMKLNNNCELNNEHNNNFIYDTNHIISNDITTCDILKEAQNTHSTILNNNNNNNNNDDDSINYTNKNEYNKNDMEHQNIHGDDYNDVLLNEKDLNACNEYIKNNILKNKKKLKNIEGKLKDEKNVHSHLTNEKINENIINMKDEHNKSSLNNSNKIINCITSNKTLNDFKGIKNIKKDILYSIIYPYKFRPSNLNCIINIFGSSGTGKTTLSYSIAGECECPFFYIKLPEYIRYISNDNKNNKLKIIFEHIKNEYDKAILCIDDIDIIFSSKDDSTDLYLFTYLLNIFHNSNIIVLLLSINKPNDSILYSKIQKFITLPIPTYDDRIEILQQASSEYSLSFDISYTASITYGFKRGEIFDIMKESLNLYIYNNLITKDLNINDMIKNQVDHISKNCQNINKIDCNENGVVNQKSHHIINKINNDDNASVCGYTKTNNDYLKNENISNYEELKKNDQLASHEQNILTTSTKSNDENNIVSTDMSPELFNDSSCFNNQKNHNLKEINHKRKYNTFLSSLDEWTIIEGEAEKRKIQKIIKINNDIIFESVNNIKKKMTNENICEVPNINLDNIGSLKKIKKILESKFILPVKYSNIYKHLGINKSMGILLYGPPGCGKTMLAKAISNEMKANFIAIKGPEILNKYVGESEKKVREIFSYASVYKPCLIFFDEIDSICINRSNNKSVSASDRVVNQLLSEMDGLSQREGVYIIATTNRPDIIDKALLRSGRFDQLIYISLPKYQGRVDILKKLSKNMPIDKNVSFEKISKLTRGYSGADLYGVLRESAFIALQECRDKIDIQNSSNLKINNVYINDIYKNTHQQMNKDTNVVVNIMNKHMNIQQNNFIKQDSTILLTNNMNNNKVDNIHTIHNYDNIKSNSYITNKKLSHDTNVSIDSNRKADILHDNVDNNNELSKGGNNMNQLNQNNIDDIVKISENYTNQYNTSNNINAHKVSNNNIMNIQMLDININHNNLNNSNYNKMNEEIPSSDNKNKDVSFNDHQNVFSTNNFCNNENIIKLEYNNNMEQQQKDYNNFTHNNILSTKNNQLNEKEKNNLIYEYIQKNKNILTITQKHIIQAIKIIPRSVTKEQIKYYKEICKKFK
ncbi:ATPase, putative [Plasmodium gaboni]|uniref:ATPase, putative n=1 Tax=Plasmodium gaboni TaxID=647221 RepID=A0ABY1UM53_9APIC|nr:ATPase, putative [Plasmodium gaboni]